MYMTNEFTPIALAAAIHALQDDCTDAEDCLSVITNTVDLLTADGGNQNLITFLNDDPHDPMPLLNVSGEEMTILVLVCIIFLHKEGCNLSEAVNDIRYS